MNSNEMQLNEVSEYLLEIVWLDNHGFRKEQQNRWKGPFVWNFLTTVNLLLNEVGYSSKSACILLFSFL